jgi:hypothetical protein
MHKSKKERKKERTGPTTNAPVAVSTNLFFVDQNAFVVQKHLTELKMETKKVMKLQKKN